MTRTPLDALRAALASGAGVPGRPLSAALVGQPCAGLRGGLQVDEVGTMLEALEAAGVLCCGGGRAVLTEEAGR